jgi:hypothetical protein
MLYSDVMWLMARREITKTELYIERTSKVKKQC